MAKKLKYDEVKEIIEKEKCILISKEYINVNSILEIKCQCGDIFKTSLSSFRNNKKTTCRKCSNEKLRKERSFDFEFVKQYIKECNLEYVSGEYRNKKSVLVVKCSCGNLFETNMAKIKNNGYHNCRKCRNKKISIAQTKSEKQFKKEVFNLLGDEYEILGNYINDSTKIKMKHIKCGKEYNSIPSNILRGKGCPRCKESHLEKAIARYLDNKNIKYEKEKKFDDLKFKRRLRFDFYLPYYNTCIEADGRQHFEPVEVFGGITTLNDTQKRDMLKDIYCKNKKITLLRIPYYKIKNIDIILDNFFLGNTVVSEDITRHRNA